MTSDAAPADQAIGPNRALRLIGLGALIGIPAALLAGLFLAVVHWLEDWLWDPNPAWYAILALPVIGAAIVIAARTWLPGDGGHPPLEGIGGGAVPLRNAAGIALAAIGTLAFGAVLGPEAPLVALGSVVGVAMATLGRAGEQETQVLALAGSFSAISALFGGPIVGGLLMIESGLDRGAALLPALIPGFVAAALGYVLFIGLGDWGGLNAQAIAVPGLPTYTGTHVLDLLVGIGVGVASAITVVAIRAAAAENARLGPLRLGMPRLLLAGGLAVGVLAEIANLLGGNPNDVLFSGQAAIPDLIAQGSVGIVVLLLVTKGIGYAVSLSCGFRGGPVFPAIFLGIAFGTLCVDWFDVSPTLAVSVGAAAGMAAGTRLLLTPVVFAALLVGHAGADTVPAAVLASVAAWLTAAAADRRRAVTGAA
jgi:H+/Cl- antiporter ClcA